MYTAIITPIVGKFKQLNTNKFATLFRKVGLYALQKASQMIPKDSSSFYCQTRKCCSEDPGSFFEAKESWITEP